MTYRLQYNSSEYRGLLASSLMAWAAEDRDLAIVSLEGHVLYTSRRLLALFSPTLAPLLASSHPTTLPTSLSLPYSSSTLTALLSLLTSGQASCSSPLGREVEELATLLAIPINCAAPSAAPWAVKKKNTSLSVIPVKKEVEAALEELDTNDTPSKKDGKSTSRKRVSCAICQKSFSRKQRLNDHIANIHPEAAAESVVQNDVVGARIGCDQCGKQFQTAEQLEKHSKIHLAGGQLICQYCDKTFNSPKKFGKHQESHTKPATHECEVCHKSFQSSSALRLHGAIHLPEKPFKCHLCEWQGTQKGNFKVHLKNRHGEDPDNILDLSGAPITAEVALDEITDEVEKGVVGVEEESAIEEGTEEVEELEMNGSMEG